MKSAMNRSEFGHELRPHSLRQHRKERGETQTGYWERFGVTQSRGSRFEQGAELPPPVVILLKLYQQGTITDEDLQHVRRQFATTT